MAQAFGFNGRVYWSRVRQATDGVDNIGSAGPFVIDCDGGGTPWRRDKNKMPDSSRATGVDNAQRVQDLEYFIKGDPISCDASPEIVGLAMAAMLGDDTVTTPSTGEKLHTITRVASGTAPSVFTMQQNADGATANSVRDIRPLDVLIRRFELSWSDSGFAKIKITTKTTGRVGTTADIGGPASVATYVPGNKINVLVAPVTDEQSAWNGSYTAPASPGVFANAGNIAGERDLAGLIKSGTLWVEQILGEGTEKGGGSSTGAGIYDIVPRIKTLNAGLDLTWLLNDTTDDFIYDLFGANYPRYTILVECVLDKLVNTHPYGFMTALPFCDLLQTPDPSSGLDSIRDSVKFRADKTYTGTSREIIAHFNYDQTTGVYNN